MKLRRNFLPRTLQDTVVTSFVTVIIPVVYWFEIFIVMPTVYEQWSSWYNFHFLLGTFILLNITTNFVGVIICETSIRGLVMPAKLEENWRFCAVCECVAPPRSWHCNICKTCILKRDHHCIFTGCCIGHNNLRYFIVFVFYMFVATLYASYYNLFFIINSVDLSTWVTVVKLLFPLAMLFVEYSLNQLFLFLVLIVGVGCLFTGVLLYFHASLICKGTVTYERKCKKRLYDYGVWDNVRLVLGKRWYWTWVCPFVESELSHDGVYWEPVESLKNK